MPSSKQLQHVDIYTDGACSPNPGRGGWGALLISRTHAKCLEISGSESETTNNRMELTAAIEALKALKQSCEVALYTDSNYLCNAFEENWLESWQKKNWKTSSGKKVLNRDLWEKLLKLSGLHDIKWHWVRGHEGHPENERADELAVEARKHLDEEN